MHRTEPGVELARFCQTLRDDPEYQRQRAWRIAAGKADHVLSFELRQEHTPRARRRPARARRLLLEFRYYDTRPDEVAQIQDARGRAMVEGYLRRRAAGRDNLDQELKVASSRFPDLAALQRPGVLRERFVRRWHRGKVAKSLELIILKIADTLDERHGTPRDLRIIFHGPCRDPMARSSEAVSAPASAQPAARVPRPARTPSSGTVMLDGEEYVQESGE